MCHMLCIEKRINLSYLHITEVLYLVNVLPLLFINFLSIDWFTVVL